MKGVWKVLGVVAMVIVFAFSGAIGKLIGKASADSYATGKKEGQLDQLLLSTASKINERLPMMVDSETRWDSTIGINKTMRYKYTLVNFPASRFSEQDLNIALKQTIVNNVCTSKEMQVFVKNDVTIAYDYYGNDGKQIGVISVTPSQCTH